MKYYSSLKQMTWVGLGWDERGRGGRKERRQGGRREGRDRRRGSEKEERGEKDE